MNRVATLLILGLLTPWAIAEPWVEPATKIAFVEIPAGCYAMGSPEEVMPDPGGVLKRHPAYYKPLSSDEVPVHEVCLDRFWIGRHEVRVRDWNLLMGDVRKINDSEVSRAAAGISWEEAKQFAERLSQQTGEPFRLPTEAEWEYACRGGFDGPLVVTSNQLVGTAWYNRGGARRTEPQPVEQLEPNPFGLYDMLGNVWEWVADNYAADAYQQHARENPLLVKEGAPRVIRGGSFRTEPRQTRCTARGKLAQSQNLTSVGFRLVREHR